MSDTLLADGLDHHRARRFDAARARYGAVLALEPQHADAMHLLGLAAHEAGAHAEAIGHLERAVALRPRVALFRANLGTTRLAAGDAAGAIADFRAALALDDRDDDAWTNLGLALLQLDRAADAEPCLRAALTLAPGRADAAGNLAECLRRRGDAAAPAEAETYYRAALRLCPEHVASLSNLGNMLTVQSRLDEAETLLRRAVALRPDADSQHNLAGLLAAAGRLDEAQAAAQATLALDPEHADAHYVLGTIRLLRGQFDGFAGLEWRWRRRGFALPRVLGQPRWDGSELAGRTLLLHAEQGLGDAIQMLRFVPALAAAGPVLLDVPAPLRRLAAGLGAELVPPGPAPECDVECPLPSLPFALGVQPQTLPTETPYLHPDPTQAALWRYRLATLPGVKVGLCWAGNPSYAADARRSLPPALLAALVDVAGVAFVSLQPGAAPPVPMHDWTDELADLADTAALLTALDLVVTVDTAVAHLAGALGRPVWLLNRFDSCWRWPLGRDDSLWYPTMRIIRQTRPADWAGVLEAVRRNLGAYAREARKFPM